MVFRILEGIGIGSCGFGDDELYMNVIEIDLTSRLTETVGKQGGWIVTS